MAKHLKKQKKRLEARQIVARKGVPEVTSRVGRKMPGSMNPHKSVSRKVLK
jgi:hypothetical protein